MSKPSLISLAALLSLWFTRLLPMQSLAKQSESETAEALAVA